MQVERLASFFMELMEYFKSPTAFRSPTEMIFYIEDKPGNSQGIPAFYKFPIILRLLPH